MKKLFFKICILLVLAFVLFSGGRADVHAASAGSKKTVYVAKSGKDSNPGTSKRPYKTIKKAISVARPGTTIIVGAGRYSGRYVFPRSGKKNAYITIKNAPGKKAVLTAPASSKKESAIFDLNGKSYIKISGLEISNVKALRAYGIIFRGGEKNVTIRDNNIHHISTTRPNGEGEANAILLFGESKTPISNVSITKNRVHNNTNGWSENISVSGNCQNIKVNDNKVYNNTNIGIDFAGNAGYCKDNSKDHPRNCEAIGNEVYNCRSKYASNAGIYVDGAQNIRILRNKVYGNLYGIEVGSEIWKPGKFTSKANQVKNVTVADNKIYNNPEGGSLIGGYTPPGVKDEETGFYTGVVADTTVRGNILRNNGSGAGGYNGEIFIAKCDGVTISKNRFIKPLSKKKYPWIEYDEEIKKAGGIKKIKIEKNNTYSYI